jgi:drug/metabolite transporter (DMT)-like permease
VFPPRLALTAFILAIGWSSILFRLAAAPPLLAAGARVTIALLLLLPFFGASALRSLRAAPRYCAVAVAAGLLLCAHFAAWVPSLEYTTVAASTVLCSTAPLFTAGLEYWFLKQRISRRLWSGILLGFAGIIVVCYADLRADGVAWSARALKGDFFAILGALFAAMYYLVGRAVRAKIELGGYLVFVNASAAVALLSLSLAIGEPWFTGGHANSPSWQGITPTALLYFTLLALVPHLLGHGAANYAVRHLPATVVNVAVLGEPVLATALAIPIFGEIPKNPIEFGIGSAILIVGLLIAATDARTNE